VWVSRRAGTCDVAGRSGATGIGSRLWFRAGVGRHESNLILAIANGPVAAARADDIDVLEEGALVPVETNLTDLALGVEVDNVDLDKGG
jgi:hypothetical protein